MQKQRNNQDVAVWQCKIGRGTKNWNDERNVQKCATSKFVLRSNIRSKFIDVRYRCNVILSLHRNKNENLCRKLILANSLWNIIAETWHWLIDVRRLRLAIVNEQFSIHFLRYGKQIFGKISSLKQTYFTLQNAWMLPSRLISQFKMTEIIRKCIIKPEQRITGGMWLICRSSIVKHKLCWAKEKKKDCSVRKHFVCTVKKYRNNR